MTVLNKIRKSIRALKNPMCWPEPMTSPPPRNRSHAEVDRVRCDGRTCRSNAALRSNRLSRVTEFSSATSYILLSMDESCLNNYCSYVFASKTIVSARYTSDTLFINQIIPDFCSFHSKNQNIDWWARVFCCWSKDMELTACWCTHNHLRFFFSI